MTEADRRTRPLEGRRALVTGASGRLGRALAIALARHGALPVIQYRSDERGAEETVRRLRAVGVESCALQADLAHPGACAGLVEQTRAYLGGLDLLVNNAAIFGRAPLEDMAAADFDRHMASNARPVYELTLHAGRLMKAEGGGDVLNLADVAALRPWPAYVAYSASKAAVVSLTRGFAKALAPEVRVNAIAPGPVLPPVGADEAQGQAAIEATLLKRWGSPEDVTAAALFLLRAQYVTGCVLCVDGGRSIS